MSNGKEHNRKNRSPGTAKEMPNMIQPIIMGSKEVGIMTGEIKEVAEAMTAGEAKEEEEMMDGADKEEVMDGD